MRRHPLLQHHTLTQHPWPATPHHRPHFRLAVFLQAPCPVLLSGSRTVESARFVTVTTTDAADATHGAVIQDILVVHFINKTGARTETRLGVTPCHICIRHKCST